MSRTAEAETELAWNTELTSVRQWDLVIKLQSLSQHACILSHDPNGNAYKQYTSS